MTNFFKTITGKLLLPLPLFALGIMGIAAYVIPESIKRDVERAAIVQAQETVSQYETIRKYYTENVVAPILAEGHITVTSDHAGQSERIPLPATFIHDISAALNSDQVRIRLYSPFPFPNRSERILDSYQTEAWEFLNANPDQTFSRRETVNGQRVMRVAIADRMVADACVSCHNTHPNTPRTGWSLGDVRGVLEVVNLIEDDFIAANTVGLKLVGLFAFLVAALIAGIAYINHGLINPITQMTRAMKRLAENDLSVEIPDKNSTIEVAAMTKALRVFKENAIVQKRLTHDAEASEQRVLWANEDLEASRERFDLAVAGSNDVIWDWDIPANTVYYSPRFNQLLGHEDATYVIDERAFIESLHPNDLPVYMRAMADHLSRDIPFDVQYRLRHKSGSYSWFRGRGIAIRDEEGTAVRMAGSICDISELVTARKRAEAASNAKSEFLTNMSHEMRTPLNAIIGFSKLIKDSDQSPLQEKTQEFAHFIHASGQHLLQLVSDILDLSCGEIGALKLSFVQQDIVELFDQCEAILQNSALEAGIDISFEVAPDVPALFVDPLRVKQILLNLTGNAFKFTDAKGWIKVRAISNDASEIVITVSDNGIGIAEDDISFVLEKFSQVRDGHTSPHDGAGIGLALSKSLMESHGGTLSIDSELGKGTSVTLTFPNEITAAQQLSPSLTTSAACR